VRIRFGGEADLSRWPLVGRDDELALAAEAVARHGGVVLTGAAGVGKTRLAHEVVAGAGAHGRTEWIRATEAAAQVPLGAAAHLVPGTAVESGRDATLRAIVAALHQEREREPMLLGVDDAHLLDDASAALVHLLATTRTASVVITVRSGERPPDSIVALWKDGQLPLIALQALSRPEVEGLVETVLEGPVEGAVHHFLWASSAGNALFLRELVRHGIESGALRWDRDLWRWLGRFEPGERLQDVVGLRMGALTDDERATLELVAVGEPLTVACLRSLGVAEMAEHLERRGLLASRRAAMTEIGLAHPLFGEVVRARMPSSRLDAVRLRLAEAVEATGAGGPADQFRVVLWRADAGDRSRPQQARTAARRALSLWAPDVAERLARAALDAGPDLEAGYLLGEALSDLGRSADAMAAWEAVEDLPGPDRIRAFLANAQAATLNFHFDRAADARAVLQRAIERVEEEDSRLVLLGALAFFGATNTLEPTGDAGEAARVTPQAVLATVIASTTGGRFDRAVQMVDEAEATVRVWGDDFPTAALLLRLNRNWARLLGGHVREAETEADARYAAAVAEHADYPRVTWCLLRGMVATLRGLPVRATGALREAVALAGTDDRGWLRPMHAYLAMAAALVGDHAAAEHHEARAAELNKSIDGVFSVDVARSRAWVRAARGELTAAAEEARRAADRAASHDQGALEVLALHDLARIGRAAEVADRLEALRAVVDGELVDVMADHARALAGEDGAALDAVAASFAALSLDLYAAEASSAAARAHARAGRKASAYASRDRARQHAERCEGARTPALAWADRPDDLTAREREVAELAAAGLPSRGIAERLGITTRTVDNLLGRVYVKLGISGRSELVEVFARPRE
jgi:DNA-binding CsgD family transcriptional regulator/tetratricopeptide (TPR) repeat protein